MPDLDKKPWSTVVAVLGEDILPIVLIIVVALIAIRLARAEPARGSWPVFLPGGQTARINPKLPAHRRGLQPRTARTARDS